MNQLTPALIWLVVSTPKKNEFVSWDDCSQYGKKSSQPPTSYITIIFPLLLVYTLWKTTINHHYWRDWIWIWEIFRFPRLQRSTWSRCSVRFPVGRNPWVGNGWVAGGCWDDDITNVMTLWIIPENSLRLDAPVRKTHHFNFTIQISDFNKKIGIMKI